MDYKEKYEHGLECMTREDEQPLLLDLCARLPYGVKGRCEIDASYDTSFDTIYQLHKFDAVLEGIKDGLLFVTPLIEGENEQEFANEEVAEGIDIWDFKPYLRPLSSMTEEEYNEMFQQLYSAQEEFFRNCNNADTIGKTITYDLVRYDWLNKKMFDYRGLIPRGLAISTEEFNPYKDFKL